MTYRTWNTFRRIPLHVNAVDTLTANLDLPWDVKRAWNAAHILWTVSPGIADGNRIPPVEKLPRAFKLDPDGCPKDVRGRLSRWMQRELPYALQLGWSVMPFYPHHLPSPWKSWNTLWIPVTVQTAGWCISNPDLVAAGCGDPLWRAIILFRLAQMTNWKIK